MDAITIGAVVHPHSRNGTEITQYPQFYPEGCPCVGELLLLYPDQGGGVMR